MDRIRGNFLGGLLNVAVDELETTLDGTGIAHIPEITGGDQVMAISLDPNSAFGEPEIVHITDHVAGAQTCTVLRGMEGTTPRPHGVDVRWLHAPTAEDFAEPPQLYAAKTASLIVPPDETWYSNPTATISDPLRLHSGHWSGTGNYAGVGNTANPHLIVDLQYERELSHIEYVQYCGDNRAYYGVSWATSLDGLTWDWLEYRPEGQPVQNYWGPKYVNAIGRIARYVRYTAYGSTSNDGNHLDHIGIFELIDPSEIIV